MPTIRKLAPEEVQATQQKALSQRQLVAQEYDQLLADFSLGDYGSVELGDDENRLTVRNRLQMAAHRKNVALRFERTRGSSIRFEVVEPEQEDQVQDQDKASDEEIPVGTDVPPKKKRGRPRKQ